MNKMSKNKIWVIIIQMEKFKKGGTGYTVTNGKGEIKLHSDELYHYNYSLLGYNTMCSSKNLQSGKVWKRISTEIVFRLRGFKEQNSDS